MPTFYLTVGVQYAHEEHPQGLHPDAWVEIEAESYAAARQLTFQIFAKRWASLYDPRFEDGFDRSVHPRGCQLRIVKPATLEVKMSPVETEPLR